MLLRPVVVAFTTGGKLSFGQVIDSLSRSYLSYVSGVVGPVLAPVSPSITLPVITVPVVRAWQSRSVCVINVRCRVV